MSKIRTIPEWIARTIVPAFGDPTRLQPGKVAPFVARRETELGLGLAQAGVPTSLPTVFVAPSAAVLGARLGAAGVGRSLTRSATNLVAGAGLGFPIVLSKLSIRRGLAPAL